MTVLYIASDERGAGKTAFCASLASLLNQRGITAAAIKPIVDESELIDAPEPLMFAPGADDVSSGSPWPLVLNSRGLTKQFVKAAAGLVQQLAENHQVVLVEGSNSLESGDGKKLAEALGAKVLAVVTHRQGMDVSDLSQWKHSHMDSFLGVIFNSRRQYLGTEVNETLLPALAMEQIRSFGVIPESRTLLAVTVGQIAKHLEARFLTEENDLNALVEYFMVGGWVLDEGRLYFETHDNKAVLMKGNRPDIQMAALSTPTKAMICTGGLEPIEYVFYEAQETGAALMVVSTDTVSTMESLNTIQGQARFDNQVKVQRFVELLENYVDIEGLLVLLDIQGN